MIRVVAIPGQLAPGFLHQRADRQDIRFQNFGGVFLGKAFQRHKQEGLPGPRRHVRQALRRRSVTPERVLPAIERDGIPDLGV